MIEIKSERLGNGLGDNNGLSWPGGYARVMGAHLCEMRRFAAWLKLDCAPFDRHRQVSPKSGRTLVP